jgi:hypothetical protein
MDPVSPEDDLLAGAQQETQQGKEAGKDYH